MSRMEDLTVKCRTLTYDLERMRSLHGKEVEKAVNAERESNLHKSRLAYVPSLLFASVPSKWYHRTSVRTLQAVENAHKQTAADLQRTKTLLQGVRATFQIEIKKKEKEIERVLDKWQKIADSQSKLSATQSGMRCANVAVVDGAHVGKGLGFLDVALEQSEQARTHLGDENLMLRKLILKTVNELQSLQFKARNMLPCDSVLEEVGCPEFRMHCNSNFPIAIAFFYDIIIRSFDAFGDRRQSFELLRFFGTINLRLGSRDHLRQNFPPPQFPSL